MTSARYTIIISVMISEPGTIVLLNGTSSSGKTTLVRALQQLLDAPFLDAGLDRFLWMLPKRYLDRPLWDEVLGLATEAGPVGEQLVSGMHHAILALATAGNHVLADLVLVEPHWTAECARLFAPLPAYLIGVRCPLPVLIAREQARRDRTLGQAAAQFERVHSHGLYDFEVDTSLLSVEEAALQIKAFLESGTTPVALRHLLDNELAAGS